MYFSLIQELAPDPLKTLRVLVDHLHYSLIADEF